MTDLKKITQIEYPYEKNQDIESTMSISSPENISQITCFSENYVTRISNVVEEMIIEDKNEVEKKFKPLKIKEKERKAHVRWSKKEENFFYEMLKKYGMNFEFIEAEFMKNGIFRTRKQIMLKFKREDKINENKINEVLR